LVGANDNGSSTTARCNLARFRLGKSERAAGWIQKSTAAASS
jgi:hypothetical protein